MKKIVEEILTESTENQNKPAENKSCLCCIVLGGVHKLRLQDLSFFWPPTPLRYKNLQKVDFFDRLTHFLL